MVPFCLHAVATTPAGQMESVRSYDFIHSAFPRLVAGQLLHHSFRGLLGVYFCYGLHARQVALRPSAPEASAVSLPPLLL